MIAILGITPNGTVTNASPITFTFQFSEAVTGFEATDISLTNGSAGTFTAVDSDTYTLLVTPTSDGVVSVNVTAADAVTDGNTPASASVTSDRTVPGLSITPDGTTTTTTPLTFTFQFSETVTGFSVGDVSLTNGTAGTFSVVDGDTYKLLVAPIAPGAVIVRVAANAAQDAAMNGNTSAMATVTVEATVDELPLVLNQRVAGQIHNQFNSDRWTFSANAGQLVRFDLVNATSTGIVFSLVGPNGASVFDGLTEDLDFINLPTSGRYVLSVRGTNGQIGAYAFRLEETSAIDLPLGTLHNGTFAGSGQTQLFRVQVPTAKPLFVNLDDSSSTNRNELYAKFGAPPTRADYDDRSTTPGADQSLLVSNANAGTWYVLVYAESVPSPGNFTLQASAADIRLTNVTPDHYSQNASATLTLTGAGFLSPRTVELVAGNGTAYSAESVDVDSFTQLTATINLAGVPTETYSVRVTGLGGSVDVLANAFTVRPAGSPKLVTNLVIPGRLGRHAVATIYVEYANTGSIAMPAPLLVLQSGDQDNSDKPFLTLDQSRITQGFWTSALPDGFSHTIQILASGNTPGVLQPGESFRVGSGTE